MSDGCYLCSESASIDSDPCDDCERRWWEHPILIPEADLIEEAPRG